MKKIISTVLLGVICTAAICQTQPKWKLVWHENFNSSKLDTSKWSVIKRGGSHWNRYMSDAKDLIQFENGNIVLSGRVNKDLKADTSRYVTGGIISENKYTFTYGRIDIRARLGSATGAWPAFWLLPQEVQWPDGGEIDIMEHLNFDDFVYQTAHSTYTYTLGIKIPVPGGTGKIKPDQYNVYSLEWYPDRLVWLINGHATFIYPRIESDKNVQWPFTTPFYILLDQQLGGKGTWVGEVDESQLPVKMWIDWVKVYAAPAVAPATPTFPL